MPVAALVALPLFGGAVLQRTAGIGLALVAAPFVVAALGARDGISFGNALQCLLCTLVLARTFRHTDRRAAALLLLGAVVTVPLGALVVAHTDEAVLLVLLGSLTLAAVAVSALPAGRMRPARVVPGRAGGGRAGGGRAGGGRAGAVVAGALAGFLNATAGVGGPMVSAYATSRGWSRETFVPTAQCVLLLINAGAVAVKGLPAEPWPVWGAGVLALAAGLGVGELASRRVGPATGRRLVVGVAALGALATVVRGLLAL